jgi:hypothetical protein
VLVITWSIAIFVTVKSLEDMDGVLLHTFVTYRCYVYIKNAKIGTNQRFNEEFEFTIIFYRSAIEENDFLYVLPKVLNYVKTRYLRFAQLIECLAIHIGT